MLDLHAITDRDQYNGESLEGIYQKIAFIREHGRKLKTIECGMEFWAVGPDVWFIQSATQYNWSGPYHRWVLKNQSTSGLEAAMQEARRECREGGICYCEYSDTLRQFPSNYLLAVRNNGRFVPTPDAASTINAHSLGIALEQHDDAPTPQVLAKQLSKAFYG